ncbi:Cytochrome P450 monooxygenase pyvB [Cladobotryum mycophilum]|uniref:Cytochrome P450 monooxygenase pyvB n=1 Tax=Cladobotryum mycophilum TaxID=491253 RepID=A0ABR0S5R0_9HYPO
MAILSVVAIWLVLLAVSYLLGRKTNRIPRYHGKARFNLLSDALEFVTDPIEVIRKATEKCGNIFSLQILIVYTVWLRGNTLNKFYLHTREDVWSFVGGMGIFLNKIIDAGYWNHYKVLLASVSRYINRAAAQEYANIVTLEETHKEAAHWEAEGDIKLFESMSGMVHKIIVRSLMGEDFYQHNAEELLQLLHAMEADIGSPWCFIFPDWVPHPPAKRLQKARDRVKEIFYERLSERANIEKSKSRKLEDYIAFTMEDKLTAPLKDLMPSHHTLLLFAAHTSTAAGIAWNIITLLRHPETMKKVTDELRSNPDTDDSLLLQACIKETSRRYCGMKLLRLARENVKLPDTEYNIPKGSVVSISPYLTHHDPNNFPNPDEWLPERWINEEDNKIRHVDNSNGVQYMPFGAGSHRCVGEKLAVIMVFRSLITLLREYDIEWADPEIPQTTDFENLNFDKVGSPWLRGDVKVRIRKI